jgi:hypothetical protein
VRSEQFAQLPDARLVHDQVDACRPYRSHVRPRHFRIHTTLNALHTTAYASRTRERFRPRHIVNGAREGRCSPISAPGAAAPGGRHRRVRPGELHGRFNAPP